MNLFLVTTCWICEKHELKIFRCVSNTGILTQLNYKLCRTYKTRRKNGAADFIKVNMLLCRIDTFFYFWIIKSLIQVWTTDLFQDISSTTKLIGITVLENMSDGHVSILENRKKICYKCNVTDFPWNTFDITFNTIPISKRNWMAKIWMSTRHN